MAEQYMVINGNEFCGPYDRDDAQELADRGGGYTVLLSRLVHAGIMYSKIARAVTDLRPIVDSLESGLKWADGDYDQREEPDEQ